jgi:hypothetical protein
MTNETFTYDNYTFEIEHDIKQIKVKLIDNSLMEMYEEIINEENIKIKPIKKFYLIFTRSLNKQESYNISIINQNSKIQCSFSYNNEIIDLEDCFVLNKMTGNNSRELLNSNIKSFDMSTSISIFERCKKYIEQQINDMLTPVFGCNIKTGEPIKFNINSKVLDFRPFNLEPCEYYESEGGKPWVFFENYSINEFNKFTKVQKIIFDSVLSPIYINNSSVNIDINDRRYQVTTASVGSPSDVVGSIGYIHKHKSTGSIFNSGIISFPSVTEIEIYISKFDQLSKDLYDQLSSFIAFISLPNLKKISIINNGCSLLYNPTFILSNLRNSFHKYRDIPKVDHIILKNMNIDPTTFSQALLLATKYKIKFEII